MTIQMNSGKTVKPRKARVKKIKHKTKVAVTDSGNIQFQCLCGVKGTIFAQVESLGIAITAAYAEADAHYKPKPKK